MSQARRSNIGEGRADTVYIVDDYDGVCQAYQSLFRSLGYKATTFRSGFDFLNSFKPATPSCCLLDIRLKDESGFFILSQMRERDIEIPVIFMSCDEDLLLSVKAMTVAKFDLFSKFSNVCNLIAAVRAALNADRMRLLAHRSADLVFETCAHAGLSWLGRDFLGGKYSQLHEMFRFGYAL
jgi:FixJ family two-component response regulator